MQVISATLRSFVIVMILLPSLVLADVSANDVSSGDQLVAQSLNLQPGATPVTGDGELLDPNSGEGNPSESSEDDFANEPVNTGTPGANDPKASPGSGNGDASLPEIHSSQSRGMVVTSESDISWTVTVLDPDGMLVFNALVIPRNTDWMVSGEEVTNAEGVAVFGDLGGGFMTFEVTALNGLRGSGSAAMDDSGHTSLTVQLTGDSSSGPIVIRFEALELKSGEFLRDATFRIFDDSGTLLHTLVADGADVVFSGELPNGYYTVEVSGAGDEAGYGQFFVPQVETVTVLMRELQASHAISRW